MTRYRIWLSFALLLVVLAFMPKDVQSRQYWEATMKFNPDSGSLWHYITQVQLGGLEIEPGNRNYIAGSICPAAILPAGADGILPTARNNGRAKYFCLIK